MDQIGEIIRTLRERLGLTHEQLGARYALPSGDVVRHIEQGSATPALETWLCIARDANVSEGHAVRLWVCSHLPERYRGHIAWSESAKQDSGPSLEPGEAGPTALDPDADDELDRTAGCLADVVDDRFLRLMREIRRWG